jgi:hypothetical protein
VICKILNAGTLTDKGFWQGEIYNLDVTAIIPPIFFIGITCISIPYREFTDIDEINIQQTCAD